ncbi:chloride channel protein [bacterium]|nr:chloride channel protein [bacterium]
MSLSDSLRGWSARFFRWQWGKRPAADNKFILLVPVVGLVTGLMAVLIAHLIAWLQKLLWGSGENLLQTAAFMPWYAMLLVLGFGGLVVGLIGRTFRTETRGGGTAGMVQSLALRGGVLSLRQSLPRVAAGVVTVASGGSLGREGPMIQICGTLGSHLGRRLGLPTAQLRILLCAAAGAAIAAVYNAPIGGSLFAIEILMGNFALEVFGPVVIASVISTLVFRSAMGNLPRFIVPAYELVSGWELIGYLVLGVIGGLLSALFIRSLFWAEDLNAKVPLPKWLKPLLGFLLVGGIGIFYPQVFGNGYDAVNLALHEQLPLTLLLVLALAKLVATAVTHGSGGSGGLFTPSLMIGSMVGGAFGMIVHQWFPTITAGHGAYALVGMGAIVAGTTGAPLTAIMMIFEQTNSYQIILPLMFACIISTLTVRLLRVPSIHHETLRRRGVVLPRGPEAGIMQALRVRDLMHEDAPSVPPSASFAELLELCINTRYQNVYVTDPNGRFLGAVPLQTIKQMLHQRENLNSVVAYDLINERFAVVTPEDRLADTMEKFWRQNSERLPVIEDLQGRKLVGWISKQDLIGIYSQEILNKPSLLATFQMTDEHGPRKVYVPLPEGFLIQTVTLPPGVPECSLADLAPRSAHGVHVLQVTRTDPETGRPQHDLPGPATRVRPADQLVLIGQAANIAGFQDALRRRVEPPPNPP